MIRVPRANDELETALLEKPLVEKSVDCLPVVVTCQILANEIETLKYNLVRG